MRQRHCGYSFHHFLFFCISYLFPSLFALSLSTLSRIFVHLQTISLWASEEGYTDYQVICIIALMNNVVLIMLLIAPYMTSQRSFTFSEFQQTRMHQLLAFLLYPYYVKQMFIMINYDRTYDMQMHFCVFILLNFFISFLPWLILYHNWITHHSTKFMAGSKYGRKKCIDQYDSFLQWRTLLGMMFEFRI